MLPILRLQYAGVRYQKGQPTTFVCDHGLRVERGLVLELLVWKRQDEVNEPDEGLYKTEAVVQKM